MEFSQGKSAYYSMTQGENSNLYFLKNHSKNKNLIFQSKDNGLTWTGTDYSLEKSFMSIEKLIGANSKGDLYAFISENDNHTHCYDNEGVFKSEDGGKNWSHVLYMPVYTSLLTDFKHIICIEYQSNLKISKHKLY